MTLSTTTSRVTYPGTGSTGPFAFNFKVFTASDLLVTKRSISTGVETPLVFINDYSVTGAGETSGTITLTAALLSTESITIRRVVHLTQDVSIRNEGTFFPAAHEDEFDRLVMLAQQHQDHLDRSVGLSESYDPIGYGLRFSPGAAGQVLGWGSPTQLTNLTISSGATVLPGNGRTVGSLSAYLANNAVFNIADYLPAGYIDGVTDATNAINACYAACPDGGTMLVPIACLRHTQKLSFNRPVNIQGLGPGSAFCPDLSSKAVDGVVINDTASPTILYRVRLDNFAVLSNKTNACRDAFVCNRLAACEVNVHVKVSAFRYGTRLVGGINCKFRIVTSTNFSYPYPAGGPGSDSLRIQRDKPGSLSFNNNDLYLLIEGFGNGCWIEDQANQGNNNIRGVIEGTSLGTRSFYAKGCLGLNIDGLHCESNAGAFELDTCQISQIANGAQFIPSGIAAQIILTACDKIWFGSVNLGTITADAACTNIFISPGTRYSTVRDPAGVIRNQSNAIVNNTASTTSGTPVTLLAGNTRGQGRYAVTAYVQNLGSSYQAIADFVYDGATLSRVGGTNAALMTITLSGNNIQATQSSGSKQMIAYIIQFISAS